MMEKICPMNLAASEGLGADNMSCMIIEFNNQVDLFAMIINWVLKA